MQDNKGIAMKFILPIFMFLAMATISSAADTNNMEFAIYCETESQWVYVGYDLVPLTVSPPWVLILSPPPTLLRTGAFLFLQAPVAQW